MVTEVGLLQIHSSPYICCCIEAFDFKSCAFLILELMSKNVTAILDSTKLQYTENICKYILNETLKGVEFLHKRHILHRDMKSDNILYNEEGDIKLADFGCAAQLTVQKN